MLCGARPASSSATTVRCISHASEGALCLSEPRSTAVYISCGVLVVRRFNKYEFVAPDPSRVPM
jgi:hypothetical protein